VQPPHHPPFCISLQRNERESRNRFTYLDRLVILQTANFDVWRSMTLKPTENPLRFWHHGPTGEEHRATVLQGWNLKLQNHVMFVAILFSPQFYWKVIDIHHCLSLRQIARWFDLRIWWNSYYNRFSWPPSSHTDPIPRKEKKEKMSCDENTWDLLSSQVSYVPDRSVSCSHHVVH